MKKNYEPPEWAIERMPFTDVVTLSNGGVGNMDDLDDNATDLD